MKLIVALDVDSIVQAEGLVDLLKPKVEYFKVGSRLYTAEGPAVIDMINKKGCRVFLDLKYYDIPTVVASAVKHAAKKKVFSVSLHISGGREMLEKCVEIKGRPQIWGITVLTSMDEAAFKETGMNKDIPAQVEHLANLAKSCGVEGVVSSPREIPLVKIIGGLNCIVPGIRSSKDYGRDQKRTMTAKEAKILGADYIVVGRPIINAADPFFSAESILREIA